MRRAYNGKYTLPNYYIKYSYCSFHYSTCLPDGRVLLQFPYVLIDPRGVFTSGRLAFIKIMDKLMLLFGRTKPFIEFAEFAANYPT
jgi:hypothetical protein